MSITSQIRNIDIINVINTEGVELKRTGNKYVGLCPFHSEKNPSFTVFSNNRFKCFGCGESGDAVDLIQRLHGCDFKDALKFLGIRKGSLFAKEYRAIKKRKLQRQQAEKQKQRERDLAYTLAFLICSAYKSMESITPDNLDDFCDTLDSLSWWEYCHETLCIGSDSEKQQCREELKNMPTVKRNTIFKPDFDLGSWVRGSFDG